MAHVGADHRADHTEDQAEKYGVETKKIMEKKAVLWYNFGRKQTGGTP